MAHGPLERVVSQQCFLETFPECLHAAELPDSWFVTKLLRVTYPAPGIAAATNALALAEAAHLEVANASHLLTAMSTKMVEPDIPGA